MKSLLSLAWLVTMAALLFPQIASAQHADYDELVTTHARANGLPEALVHRVIVRESGYRPALVGRGGTIGLMQIKLATARSLGYTGDAAGLRDPNTNLTYAREISRRRLSRRQWRPQPRRAYYAARLLRSRQNASGVDASGKPDQRCRRRQCRAGSEASRSRARSVQFPRQTR